MPDSSITVTATYIKNKVGTFSLSVSTEHGVITKTPNSPYYDSGSIVEISANADDNYLFTGWSGDLSGAMNPATVILNRNKIITAEYTPRKYPITINAVNGSVLSTPNDTVFPFGSTVSFKAVPDTGYTFVGWSGDTTGRDNPVELVIGEVNNLTANFEIKTYSLTVDEINCKVEKKPNKEKYQYGDMVQLSVSIDSGYSFIGWSGDTNSTAAVLTIKIDTAKTITATAQQDSFTIITECANGTVTIHPQKSYYHYNDTVDLIAVANDTGYTFDGWSDGSNSPNTTIQVIVKSDSSFVASFTNNNMSEVAGMKFIPAKGKSFQMGDTSASNNDTLIHTVSFTHNFYMDSTEVTQKDYDSLMSSTYTEYSTPSWVEKYGLGDNYPAYYVNWYDAILYCNARSKRAGRDTVYSYASITGIPGNDCELSNVVVDYNRNGFRLPTEAEWEYACRAGTTSDYYWGKDYKPYPSTVEDSAEIDNNCVWWRNSYNKGVNMPGYGTHSVASKLPNSFGLYDMSGNVYELCGDWYGSYSSSSAVDPTGPLSGEYKIMRGGSWNGDGEYITSNNRNYIYHSSENNYVGFRVVCP